MMFLGFFAGCWNPFEGRSAEDPSGETSRYKQPTTPQSALYNLQWSLMEKNIANFQSTLSNNFIFKLDMQDVQEYGWSVSSWNLTQETDITSAMFSRANQYQKPDTISVILMVDPDIPDPTNYTASVILYRLYRVAFPGSSYAPNDSLAARGRMKVTLTKDASNLWYISEWDDFREKSDTSNVSSWGRVKWEYR